MFQATFDSSDLFRNVVFAIGDLVNEGNLDFTEHGIHMQAMDSSHVSLVSLFLARESFSNFTCTQPKTVGINFVSLKKVLKCSKLSDSLTLKLEGEVDDVLFLKFSDADLHRTLNFELKLLDIDSERLQIPQTEYDCIIRMSSKEFQCVCRDLQLIGESLMISCTKETVKFSLSGDIGSVDLTYAHASDITDVEDISNRTNEVFIKCMKFIKLKFSIRYLSYFAKAALMSNYVSLCLSEDEPLVVEYKIDDLGHLKYYLAPKIEDDDGLD